MKKYLSSIYLLVPPLITFQLLILWFSKFTYWPEMVLYPYFLNQDFVFYRDIINPYFPLLPMLLTLVLKLFGSSFLTIKLFTYFLIIISDLVIFVSAWKLSRNLKKAFMTLFFYVFLQYSYGGNQLWFELALVPLVISAQTIIFLNLKANKNILLGGILLGVAILIKQNAIVFLLISTFFLLSQKKWHQVGLLIVPPVLMGAGLLFILYFNNLSADFLTWAVDLPLHLSTQSGFIIWPTKKQLIFMLAPLLLTIGLIFSKKLKNEKLFWEVSTIAGLMFAFPRFEDFHLQVLVAFASVLTIYLNNKQKIICVGVVILIFGMVSQKLLFQPDRFLDTQTFKLAQIIQNYPSVYLINSPELAYFIASKTPPKPYATLFPWYFEQAGFEDRFVSGLNSQSPEYIVMGPRLGGDKYALGNYIPDKLLQFIYSNYQLSRREDEFEIWQKRN